jgi:hypothetical protein
LSSGINLSCAGKGRAAAMSERKKMQVFIGNDLMVSLVIQMTFHQISFLPTFAYR